MYQVNQHSKRLQKATEIEPPSQHFQRHIQCDFLTCQVEDESTPEKEVPDFFSAAKVGDEQFWLEWRNEILCGEILGSRIKMFI